MPPMSPMSSSQENWVKLKTIVGYTFPSFILNLDADRHSHHLQDDAIPRHQVALADLCLVSIQVPTRGPSHLKFLLHSQFNRSWFWHFKKKKRKEIEGFETSKRKEIKGFYTSKIKKEKKKVLTLQKEKRKEKSFDTSKRKKKKGFHTSKRKK